MLSWKGKSKKFKQLIFRLCIYVCYIPVQVENAHVTGQSQQAILGFCSCSVKNRECGRDSLEFESTACMSSSQSWVHW